jgi:hypothetical protein
VLRSSSSSRRSWLCTLTLPPVSRSQAARPNPLPAPAPVLLSRPGLPAILTFLPSLSCPPPSPHSPCRCWC